MFDYDSIMTRLRNGEDAGDIAQEMADLLNGAIDAKRVEEEKAAKAGEKLERANKIAADLTSFLADYAGDLLPENATITGEEICDSIAMCQDIMGAVTKNPFSAFMNLFSPESNLNPGIKEKPTGTAVISWDTPDGKGSKTIDMSDKDADDVIADFLRNLGI